MDQDRDSRIARVMAIVDEAWTRIIKTSTIDVGELGAEVCPSSLEAASVKLATVHASLLGLIEASHTPSRVLSLQMATQTAQTVAYAESFAKMRASIDAGESFCVDPNNTH